MQPTQPITRYHKKDTPQPTRFKPTDAWLCPEPEPFFDDASDDSDKSTESDDDFDSSVYRDASGKRVGGLVRSTHRKNAVMMILNKGWNMRTYPYPRVRIPFTSPMVRWQNLYYCGGFGVHGPNDKDLSSDGDLIDAVIAKRKPIGFALFESDQLQAQVEKVTTAGLPYKVEPHDRLSGHTWLGVSQQTTLAETFDLLAWLESYSLMSSAAKTILLTKSDETAFWSLKDRPLSSWLTGWDYANPVTNRDLALTGLLLGYAIESTVSIMLQ